MSKLNKEENDMNSELRALVDAPLADPLKINLPLGRRPVKRSTQPARAKEAGELTKDQLRERREKAASDARHSILRYYSTTSIPFERVAAHVGLEVGQVREILKAMGRPE